VKALDISGLNVIDLFTEPVSISLENFNKISDQNSIVPRLSSAGSFSPENSMEFTNWMYGLTGSIEPLISTSTKLALRDRVDISHRVLDDQVA
jgi:hypothetical protein